MVSLCFQCSDRKHANPLDPQNPDTGGKPVGLKIYSEFDTIVLSWNRISVNGLMGYNIYRKISGDTSFSVVYLTPADSAQFFDRHVTYNLKHTYQISALTSGYESPKSDSVSIVPGPTNIWVTDAYNRRIIKISHDGLHEISRISVDGYPWDIALDTNDRSIWYGDVLWGWVYHVKNDNWTYYSSPTSWWEPVDLMFDQEREILWVADEQGKIIRILTTFADSLQEIDNVVFKTPFSIAINRQTGYCWMADPQSKNVFRISDDGKTIKMINVSFVRPMAVAVNSMDGSCWVADSSRIVKLLSDGSFSFSFEGQLQYAYTLEVNQNTGELWVVDFGITSNDSRLIKFDEHGNKLFQITGFNFPKAIAINLDDNGCVVADTENGRVVRVSSRGEILSEIGNYYYPRGIAIEYSED